MESSSAFAGPSIAKDYDEWQRKLLRLWNKLSDIESSRTHAIYNSNTSNYNKFIHFRKIDKHELIAGGFEPDPNYEKLLSSGKDNDELPTNYVDGKSKDANKKKNRPFTSMPRKPVPYGFSEERSFKLIHTDWALVRSILLGNNFKQTESHDWNLLWTNSGGKPYLYTGLNEFQKVNHFPSSSEITRKNMLATNILIMQNKFGKKE